MRPNAYDRTRKGDGKAYRRQPDEKCPSTYELSLSFIYHLCPLLSLIFDDKPILSH